MLVTAPISRPPALPPLIASRSLLVYFCAMRCSAAAMKSVKVFFLFSIRPCVVPLLAQLAAAADVGHGVDHAAVERLKTVRR